MNKIYTIFDLSIAEPTLSTPDELLAQELLCDFFMEDCYESWMTDIHLFSSIPYSEAAIKKMANDIFEEGLEFYNDYMMIIESEVFE